MGEEIGGPLMQGAGEAESDEERRAEVLWKRPLLEKDGQHERNLVECGGGTFDVLALQVSDPGRARCRDGCEAMQDPGRLNTGRLDATAGAVVILSTSWVFRKA